MILAAVGIGSLARTSAPLAATTSVFKPAADAYVTKAHPNLNFGRARELRLDARPKERSYLRFAVADLDGPVLRATLYVYVKRGSGQTVRAWSVRNRGWRESTITYWNAPALLRAVGSAKNVRRGWEAIDVTAAMSGEGRVTVALTTRSSTKVRLASRKTTHPPRLVVATETSPPSGTAYYVDREGGSDENAGTSPFSAWKTLAKASSTVLAPGDQLLLKRDVSWAGSLEIAESGTFSNPISIGAYGVGRMPVVREASSCVVLAGSYLVLRNLHAHNCSWAGFDVSGSHNRVERTTSTNNVAGVDIRAGATGNAVVRNRIRDNNKMSVLTPSPTDDDTGAYGVLLHGDGTEVAYNTISGSDAFSYDYGRDGSAIEIFGARNSNIHHNLSVDNLAFTELGNSRSADNTYVENVVRSSLATAEFLITRGSASTWGPVLRTQAYNNSVLLTGASSQGFVCHGGCSTDILTFRNNVIQAVYKVGYADGAFSESNNLFYGGIAQFALGPGSVIANPRFVDPSGGDLHLRATSPAVDAGIDVGLSRDFDGVFVPQDGDGDGIAVPDLGAFERQAPTVGGDTSPPSAPTAFQATGSTQGSISTSWTASNDNVGVQGYRLYRGTTSVATTNATGFTFTGLACGSGYTLGVEAYDAAGNTSPRATLSATTAACSVDDYVVAAAGDVACAPPGTPGATTCHQQATAELIKAIDPTKVLMLGDAQYETGTLANFSTVYDPSWGAFKAKTLVTTGGSHDFYGGGDFFTYFGTASMPRGAYNPFSYELGNWHIISLNSYCEDSNVGGCGTGGSQYSWLQADLEANTKPCTLAMWHEPYWTSGYRHNNDTVTRPYLDLLYEHRADLLLTGHEHEYERFFPQRPDGTLDANGIRAFVVGTGGKSLETAWGTIEPNSAARQRDTFGVLELTLHSSSYDWRFVPEAGQTYTDTGSDSCH
jgi:hypothetical protein